MARRKPADTKPWMEDVRQEIDARMRQASAGPREQRILEIPASLARFDSEIERLRKALATLQDRLVPILASEPDPPSTVDGSATKPATTMLGAHLENRADSVTAFARMVERMVGRMEL